MNIFPSIKKTLSCLLCFMELVSFIVFIVLVKQVFKRLHFAVHTLNYIETKNVCISHNGIMILKAHFLFFSKLLHTVCPTPLADISAA